MAAEADGAVVVADRSGADGHEEQAERAGPPPAPGPRAAAPRRRRSPPWPAPRRAPPRPARPEPGHPLGQRGVGRRGPAASSTARPAAVASGFPDRVPAWYTGPSGASDASTSARPPKAPTGRPPPITFPKHHRSGRDPRPRRRPALAQPEPGDDLVEDQQGAGGVAGRPQAREESLRRRHQAHVGRHRLDDHAGHPLVELGDPVVGGHHRLGHRAGRHAGRVGQAQGGHPAAPAGQQTVGVAVVAAGELDDPGRVR